MKKAFLSLITIGAVAVLAFTASQAFFSDTETSSGNILQAGAIDLTVSSEGEATDPSCTFNNAPGGPLFDCTDVKPGDSGETTLHFDLTSNPAWACVLVENIEDSDNTCTEPELTSEPGCTPAGNGELDNELLLTVWIDNGGGDGTACDNIQDPGEEVVVSNTALSSFALPTGDLVLPVSDTSGQSMMNAALQPGEHCLGVAWSVDPTAGNDIQTDMLAGDLTFYVEQERNNPTFTCAGHFAPTTEPQTLTLENEIINPAGPWTVITNDQIFGTLVWQGDGPTFNYTFTAQYLQANTEYSLIYYADPWAGDHPGKFIKEFTTDGAGTINSGAQSIDLGMDLPDPADANYSTGAKIWLVLSADYNSGVPSTGPMTAWNPGSYLFEGNVYINYNDTNN